MTTEHPDSKWGKPVLVFNGRAYGPSDWMGGTGFGSGQTAAQFAHHLLKGDFVGMASPTHPLVKTFLAAAGLARPGVLPLGA